jgi:predicted O-methyltransferase YrrM
MPFHFIMKLNFFALMAYLKYLRNSGSRHSVHSPFVYTLIDEVIKNKKKHPEFSLISQLRATLARNSQLLEITDFGTGRNLSNFSHRFESVASILHKSAINEKYGHVLFRLVNFFKPHAIIELGTSIGISTLYMAKANPAAIVYTVEGCSAKSERATTNFNALQASNIDQHIGRFDIVLPDLISRAGKLDFAFIDGNHTYKATMANFETLLKISHNDTIFVFDDIHWSAGMEKAWNKIVDHERVSVSVDLFRMGIIFLRNELSKQKFVIRF